MATNQLRGDAPAVAKVITLTVASTTSGHTFIVTINGKAVSYTAGSGATTATIAAAIYDLLNASTIAEFREIEWSYPGSGAVVTGTALTAGVPFTAAASGTGTFTLATPTASSGPSDASTVTNWSTGALPANTQDLLLARGEPLLYGLESLSAPVALASLRIKASFGAVGLPTVNESGGYAEYRTRAFPVATGVPVEIGEGDGEGPTRVNLSQTGVADITVLSTAARPGGSSAPVVNISGASSGTVVVAGGDVGLAADGDTLAATITTATVGDGGTLTIGPGATVTTVNQSGGRVVNYGTVGTVNGTGGVFEHYGTISAAVNADPGPFRFNWRCGGTIPAATFRGQGPTGDAPVMDCELDPRDKVLTALSFTGGAALLDPDELTEWVSPGEWDAASLAASKIGNRFYLLRADSAGAAHAALNPADLATSTNGLTIDLGIGSGPCFMLQIVGGLDDEGTLVGRVEESDDGSTWTTTSTFTTVDAANNLQRIRFFRTKRYVRWSCTITGTSPVFFTSALLFEDF